MLVSESCLLYWLNLLQYYNLKDIDECSVNSDVCGFGTCTNNPNGNSTCVNVKMEQCLEPTQTTFLHALVWKCIFQAKLMHVSL